MTTRASKLRWGAIALLALTVAGCATGSAFKQGEAAAKRGEWDNAVAYYREALGEDPKKVEVQIALERATRMSSNQHVARAKELEAQDQLAGAAAEYRQAVEFDPSNALALTKALEIERKIRDLIEASRPRSRMDDMRSLAAQSSPIPRLDPRAPLPALNFTSIAIRDVMNTIGTATGIMIQYDQGLESTLSKPFSANLAGHSLESAFNMVLSQNTLTYKILDGRTIFVYLDNTGNRAKYEDQYQQTFYLSHGDIQEVTTILNQMLTTSGTTGNRPIVTQNKSASAIVVRASAPMLGLIKNIIDAADKPKAEVLIEVTIMEVSRTRLKNLGIDLSQYSVSLTFSPDAPLTAAIPSGQSAPPINVGSFNNNPGRQSFYATVPSMIINFLEQDQQTKLLAKPQLRGREGDVLTLNLGEDIPVPQTTFLPVATGGVATQPQVQFAYRSVGVNVSMTPRVTYNDEIILAPITVDKSALGPDIIVAGQALPTFLKRTAQTGMRLRDGESNLLAGLVQDTDKEIGRSIPFVERVPILRSIFGNVNGQHDQNDIVMVVTPHIIRSREITAEDLKPFYVGTSNNLGAASGPGLMSQVPQPVAGATGTTGAVLLPPATPTVQPGQPPVTGAAGAPPATNATVPPPVTAAPPPARAPGVVPVEAAPSGPPQVPPAQILLTVPAAEMQAGGQPYTVPVSVTGVSQLGALTLTITYDPKVLKATNVSMGPFMSQGGITPTFVPKIDTATGRIDIAISRGGTNPGASGTNMLVGIMFQAVGAGTSSITVTGTALTPAGQVIPIQMPPAGKVTVK